MFQYLKNLFHIIECVVADIVFLFPAHRLTLIGVTGTDGKTTTTHAIYHLLSSVSSCSYISSISAKIGNNVIDTGFHTTTPRPFKVRQLIWQARRAGAKYFVLETTSHALSQNRVWGLPFKVGVLTNITHEHQLSHKNFTDYVNVKIKLLTMSEVPLINKDAAIFPEIQEILIKKTRQFKTYSLQDKSADFSWEKEMKTKVKQNFNKENLLAAYACCQLLGVRQDRLMASLADFELPQGRLDIVHDEHFKVIIDFAHTPNAISRLLTNLKKDIKGQGRLIHVFGAASERDDSKRPLMGVASGEGAQIVILTEEDYRHEDLQQIFNQIAPGLTKQGFGFVEPKLFDKKAPPQSYTTIENRQEAINRAVSIARKNDIVVLTGKGHEKSLNRGGIEEPWDEYEAVHQALEGAKKLKQKAQNN